MCYDLFGGAVTTSMVPCWHVVVMEYFRRHSLVIFRLLSGLGLFFGNFPLYPCPFNSLFILCKCLWVVTDVAYMSHPSHFLSKFYHQQFIFYLMQHPSIECVFIRFYIKPKFNNKLIYSGKWCEKFRSGCVFLGSLV